MVKGESIDKEGRNASIKHLYDKEYGPRKIAKTLQLPYSTVQRCVQKLIQHKTIERAKGSGRRKCLTDVEIGQIQKIAKENPEKSAQKVFHEFFLQTGKRTCVQTIRRTIHGEGRLCRHGASSSSNSDSSSSASSKATGDVEMGEAQTGDKETGDKEAGDKETGDEQETANASQSSETADQPPVKAKAKAKRKPKKEATVSQSTTDEPTQGEGDEDLPPQPKKRAKAKAKAKAKPADLGENKENAESSASAKPKRQPRAKAKKKSFRVK
eukprot:Platyproteum_vivax@DN1472_c1_g1_i1.p1